MQLTYGKYKGDYILHLNDSDLSILRAVISYALDMYTDPSLPGDKADVAQQLQDTYSALTEID